MNDVSSLPHHDMRARTPAIKFPFFLFRPLILLPICLAPQEAEPYLSQNDSNLVLSSEFFSLA